MASSPRPPRLGPLPARRLSCRGVLEVLAADWDRGGRTSRTGDVIKSVLIAHALVNVPTGEKLDRESAGIWLPDEHHAYAAKKRCPAVRAWLAQVKRMEPEVSPKLVSSDGGSVLDGQVAGEEVLALAEVVRRGEAAQHQLAAARLTHATVSRLRSP